MTNKQINKKLEKITKEISDLIYEIEQEKEMCRTAQDAIESKAGDGDRELTGREQGRWDKLEERWQDLDAIYTDLHHLDFYYLQMEE